MQVWAEGGPRQRRDGETGLRGNEVGFVCECDADHYSLLVNRAAEIFFWKCLSQLSAFRLYMGSIIDWKKNDGPLEMMKQ